MNLAMPGPRPRGQAFLRRRRSLLSWGPGFGLRWWFLQAGAVAGDGTLHRFGQVVPQMPPVSDLDRQRGALGGAFGVAAAAVPADDLHTRVGIQPGTEGLGGPLGEHVDRPAGIDVHQHGAVDMSLPQGKVIGTEHQRGPATWVGRGADQPQQRRAAHRAGQPAAQPGASAAAQGQRHHLQHHLQATGPPAIPGGQARHLLSERRLRARAVAAQEPPRLLNLFTPAGSENFFAELAELLAAAHGEPGLPGIQALFAKYDTVM
jgi:hypothetical protein